MDIPTHSADLTVSILLGQIESFWDGSFRPHLDGLEDEEYMWEPTKGSLSLRPGARHGNPRGTFPSLVPEPSNIGINPEAPVTPDGTMRHPPPNQMKTIAWRMGNMSVHLARKVENPGRLARQDFRSFPYTLSAREAVDQLDEYYGEWVRGLKSLLDSDLPRPVGPEQGPWHEDWLGLSLSHTHRWLIQTGAEILLMRDFYALHGRPSSDHFPRS